MAEFRPPKEMYFSTNNTAEARHKWKLAFRIDHVAANLSKQKGKTQVAEGYSVTFCWYGGSRDFLEFCIWH